MEPLARRRRSVAGPIILIAFGLLFLLLNFLPDFDPWPVLARYWPLSLIFLGLGRIWDYYRYRPSEVPTAGASAPPAAGAVPGTIAANPTARPSGPSGVAIALIILLMLLVAASWHARGRYEHRRFTGGMHESRTVELQSAKSVAVKARAAASFCC